MTNQDILKFITELELAVTKNEIENVAIDFGYENKNPRKINIAISLNKNEGD
jgi:hypothetical protein